MNQEKEVLVRVEGLSKKFCKDLKRSLVYVQAAASRLHRQDQLARRRRGRGGLPVRLLQEVDHRSGRHQEDGRGDHATAGRNRGVPDPGDSEFEVSDARLTEGTRCEARGPVLRASPLPRRCRAGWTADQEVPPFQGRVGWGWVCGAYHDTHPPSHLPFEGGADLLPTPPGRGRSKRNCNDRNAGRFFAHVSFPANGSHAQDRPHRGLGHGTRPG